MDPIGILKSIAGLGGLSLIFGLILAIAFKKLAVRVSEEEKKIRDLLPGANCGACGFPGCDAYAKALAEKTGEYPPDLCTVGGSETARKIGEILGMEVAETEPKVCVLRCAGGRDKAVERYEYVGPRDCRSNYILLGGNKACAYGCLGGGHCVTVCPFKAIRMGPDNLPVIDPKKCTACGICVKECPRQVLELIPRSQLVYLACKSRDKGKAVKNVCQVGCIACTLCVKICPYEGAIAMDGNLPVMDYKKCTSCGICYNKCPTKSFIDRAKARPHATITQQCDGCGECVKACQFKAIDGEPGKKHVVLKQKCIGCGRCFEVCPIRAITMIGALGYTKAA
ncbi:RnfABCDGE type electron transport complex subunit B [candidate division WOR-3 bacterium]|nr:RnfABCDGE type electron transport complex subunit B [candidate division WOR-3 bacterium]